jgi:hypothetical protein
MVLTIDFFLRTGMHHCCMPQPVDSIEACVQDRFQIIEHYGNDRFDVKGASATIDLGRRTEADVMDDRHSSRES